MFLVFEGAECAGKTTSLEVLKDFLNQYSCPFECTREPGGTPFAEDIRELFKRVSLHKDEPLPETELMLILASRFQHIQKKILPILESPQWLLCDRFMDSSYVYQGILGGISKSYIDMVAGPILRGLTPDFVFVCSPQEEVMLQRLEIRKKDSKQQDRLDSFEIEKHLKIYHGFKRIVEEKWTYPCGKVPKRYFIDTSYSLESVYEQFLSIFKQEGMV